MVNRDHFISLNMFCRSLYSYLDNNAYIELYLHKNGNRIDETEYFSSGSGILGEQGSVIYVSYFNEQHLKQPLPLFQILHLDRGEYLELHAESMTGEIHQLNFCVSLSQFDIWA